MLVDLDSLTQLDISSVFGITKMYKRSYEKDYHAQMDLVIERELDQFTLKRQGYHLFDFMSDIGGMQGLLYSGFAFFISIWNYMMFDNYMVSRLYKLE